MKNNTTKAQHNNGETKMDTTTVTLDSGRKVEITIRSANEWEVIGGILTTEESDQVDYAVQQMFSGKRMTWPN